MTTKMDADYTQFATARRASTKNNMFKPVTVASSCGTTSTASTGSSHTSSNDSTGGESAESCSIFMGLDEKSLLGKDESKIIEQDDSSKRPSLRSSATKFCFNVDEVGKLARLGRNATLRQKTPIPESISKENIYVQVSLDERARDKLAQSLADFSNNLSLPKIDPKFLDERARDKLAQSLANFSNNSKLALSTLSPNLASSLSSISPNLSADIISQAEVEERVRAAIEDDLRAVYSATAEESKLTLLVVIAVMADGSFLRSLSDVDSMVGLAEIGLMWRLFDSDDLTVYDGGVVVQNEEVQPSVFDFFFPTKDRYSLMKKLVPRVANDIMCRIAESNDHFLVEI